MMIGKVFCLGAISAEVAGIAGAQTIVDYDNQLGGNAAPVAGSSYWHSAINTGSSGQNRNVGLWSNQTAVTTSTAANISRVTASAPAGLAQGNAYELRWSFIGTAAGGNRSESEADTFLRVFSTAGTAMSSPVIDTSQLLQFDVWTSQPLRVSLLISDAAQSAAVGSPGVGSPLDVIGGTGVNELTDTGQGYGGYVLGAGQWQTVTVDFSAITVRGLTGDGLFNPATSNRIALNSLGFTPLDGEGGLQLQHEVYLDNFRLAAPVPEPATLFALAAGLAALGKRRRARK